VSILAEADAALLLSRLCEQGRVVVLTGAGISTESGIPDYRGPETARRARSPVQYREFLCAPDARRRYWARSLLGWPRFARAQPSAPHRALTQLERSRHVMGVITQNVDSLHVQAGSRALIELHGALRRVVCLSCAASLDRDALQIALARENPEFAGMSAALAPDGDADTEDARLRSFRVIDCERCGGLLKPDVVFFGENVPPPRVEAALQWLQAARSLLVVGSSLTVYSGLRFVRAAHKRGIPVAIVNLGPTRGDALASLRIDARAGAVLEDLACALGVAGA
jgi:NAD-dependent deacetylase sirtuin 4